MSNSNRPSIVPTLGTATTNPTAPEDTSHVISSGMAAPLENTALVGEGRGVNTSTATLTTSRTIRFIDLDGIDSPELFRQHVSQPNLEEFRQNATARSAFNLASSLWAMTDWIWFKRAIEHLREIAEGWKHCGLTRRNIKTARTNVATLEITFSDGTVVSMSDVFEAVAANLESEPL
jgi:hypothetical protein